MTTYELVSTLAALVALVISVVSLVRTRRNADIQTELGRINAQLAERQLERLLADEPLEDQPRFAVRVASISGLGDPQTPSYQVRIGLQIDNSGQSFLESKGVGLVCLDRGVYRNHSGAHIEFKERRNGFSIEGEHTMVIKRGADLLACSLHIHYVDKFGKDKIQQYRVIPEGGSDYLPSAVFFPLLQVSTIVPGTPWQLK
jgi:hypothetical protein